MHVFITTILTFQGVPKELRGRIWQLLTRNTPCVEYEYTNLLMQESPFQHAILVDLGICNITMHIISNSSCPKFFVGRTFPAHPYFGTSLCPGQLSLLYVLKSYAVLDPEIGYCQGLSFVAGVLLLHVAIQINICLTTN